MKSLIDNMIRSLPKYKLKQPSSKKSITYRPFVVKEEKTLYMSNETGTHEDFLETLGNIIDSCFELKTEAKKLPIFDIEYFFLKLRCKSLGEIANPTIICPYTGEKIKVEINLDEIEPVYSKDHTTEIILDSSIKIKMRYPTLDYFIEAERNFKDYYELVIDCIESIETKEEIIEAKNTSREQIQEFVDVMRKEQFEKLISFIKTMPRIEKKLEYKTSDGKTREILLKGLKDFFL